MTELWKLSIAAIGVAALAGCSSSGGAGPAGPGTPPKAGTLPVTAKGKMIAVRLPATVTSGTSDWDGLPTHQTKVTSAVASDRTAPGGVGIDGSADKDPSPNENQAGGSAQAALITAKADGTMVGGTSFIGLDKAKGSVYFENGNFGDPQVSSHDASISTVSIYNHYDKDGKATQTVLKDSTTIRYRDGKAGDAEANFGVGYIGNPTAAMPTSDVATYKGFYENGTSVYTKADGTVERMTLGDVAELAVNFTTGKVTGGVSNSQLTGGGTNLNTDIKGIAIDATITGTEYAGKAMLVDATGAQVGTVSHGNAIGGFFGAGAAETIAATSIEGKAKLGGVDSNYVLQGVIGAVKQ